MNKVFVSLAVGLLAVSAATMSSASNCQFFSNSPGDMTFDPDRVTNTGTGRWTTTSPAVVKIKAHTGNNIYVRQSLKNETNGGNPIGTPIYGEIWQSNPVDTTDAYVYDALYDYGNSQNGYQGNQRSAVERYTWTGTNGNWGIGAPLSTPTVNWNRKHFQIGPINGSQTAVGMILRIRGVADMKGTAWKNSMPAGDYRATHEILCLQ